MGNASFISWFALFVGLSFTVPQLPAGEANSQPAYVLTIESDGAMRTGATAENKLTTKTEIHYRCIARGELLALYQVSHYFKHSIDGNLMEESTATKDTLVKTTPSGKQVIDISKSKQEFRDYLNAVFEQPVCVLTLDNDGKAEKVTIPESPASKSPETADLANNLQFFHAQFPAAKDRWEQERTISSGMEHPSGTLSYEKRAAAKDSPDLIPVAVSGTMTFVLSGKNADKLTVSYTLTGEQVYDRAAKQWKSGKHELKFTSAADPANKIPGSYSGTATITLVAETSAK
jgi:hypothetical protein